MISIAVEIATAYVSIIPTARGIVSNLTKELAPIEGAAAATGTKAGSSLGGGLSRALKSSLATLPTASLGPVGALLGAGLVVGFGAALVGIGQAFGSAKVQIARETGETGAALTKTFDAVKATLREVPDSIGTVTSAVDELRRRGVPLGATFDTLAKQELELANITKTDLASNVETTTALFSKFNVPLREQPAALDAIFKGYQQSGKGLSDLTDSLKTGASALSQFGFNIFSSTALISGLERAGVNVQPALAGLRKAFATIAKEGGDPKTALQNLISEFSNGTPRAVALADAIKLFGSRAGTELATAIQAGKFDVKDLLKTITDGKGGIEQTAAATRTFGEQLAIFKNQALVALQPIASAVWKQIRADILLAAGPVEDFAKSFAHLFVSLAPVGAAVGVLAGGALLGLLNVVKLVGTGVDGVATVLDHLPAPVLIAAAAVAVLTKAFLATAPAEGVLTSATAVTAALTTETSAVAAAVTAAAEAHAADTVAVEGNTAAYAAAVTARSAAVAVIAEEAAANAGLVESQLALFTATEETLTAEGQLAFLLPEMAAGTSTYQLALAELVAEQDAASAAAVALATSESESLAITAGGESIFAGLGAGILGALNPATLLIGGLALLGGAMTLFASKESAASKEAKDLSSALFAVAGSGNVFTTSVGSAASGLADFLTKQDAAGKIKDLDRALTGTSFTLKDVSKAVTGTSQDFEGFKNSIADQLGIPPAARAFAGLTVAQQSAAVSAGQVSGATIDLANKLTASTGPIDKQRDAFIQSAEAQLRLLANADPASRAIAAQAEKIAIASTGTRGYGAALDFANEALVENQRATAAAQIASASFAPTLAQLKSQIIDGSVDTNQAADAAARYGIDLETTKGIITDTQAALKKFTSEITAGLPTSEDAINNWEKGVEAAFTKVVDASKKGPKAVATAQAALNAATDPNVVIVNLTAASNAIARFNTNIQTLLSRGLRDAADALIADPDKTAASALASKLVDNQAIATKFDQAEALYKTRLAQLTAVGQGSIAQETLTGQGIGTAVTSGVASTLHLAPVASKETQALLAELSQEQKFAKAAGDDGAAATFAMQQKLILANTAQHQTTGAVAAVRAGAAPIAAAAGTAGGSASTKFGAGLDLHAKTTAAVSKSKEVWSAQVTIDTAAAARIGGEEVGHGFVNGITSVLTSAQSIAAVTNHAATLASHLPKTVKAVLSISSPSKVAIGIGQQFVTGLSIGLADIGSVSTAGSNIASALTSNIVAGFNDLGAINAATLRLQQLFAQQTAQQAATAAADAGTQALQSFVSTVTGQLPSAQSVMQTFASQVSTSMQAVGTSLDSVHKAQAKLAADKSKFGGQVVTAQNTFNADRAGGASQAQLFKDQAKIDKAQHDATVAALLDTKALQDAKKGLTAAQHGLNIVSDPTRFIQGIQASNKQASIFQADLGKLLKGGDTLLAQKLAEAGPETAGKLAAALAGSPAKAKLAESALEQAAHFTTTFSTFLSDKFGSDPAIVGAGAKAGAQITSGVARSISATGKVVAGALSSTLAKPIVPPAGAPLQSTLAVAPGPGNGLPIQIGPFEIEVTIPMPDGTTKTVTGTAPAQTLTQAQLASLTKQKVRAAVRAQ